MLTMMQQECDELNGFAQSHIVCQTASEPKLLQECQPRKTLKLIGTQGTLESCRRLHRSNLRAIRKLIQESLNPALALDVYDWQAQLRCPLPQTKAQCFTQLHISLAA